MRALRLDHAAKVRAALSTDYPSFRKIVRQAHHVARGWLSRDRPVALHVRLVGEGAQLSLLNEGGHLRTFLQQCLRIEGLYLPTVAPVRARQTI